MFSDYIVVHEDDFQESCPVECTWERLSDRSAGKEESDAALAAFRIYQDLSPASRSLYAVALTVHRESDPTAEQPPRSLLRRVEKWSADWSWIQRALAWDNEKDRLRREEKKERLGKVEASQKKLCKLAEQIVLAPMRKVIELQQADETLKDVSDQELARSAHRVIRALPELQARERALLTPIREGKREPEVVHSEHQKWTVLKGVHPPGDVLSAEKRKDESGSNDGAQSSCAQAWFDQPCVRQVDEETGKPEPSRAFHAFTLYRDLPPNERTLRRVTELLRGTGATETAGKSGAAKRSRRREHCLRDGRKLVDEMEMEDAGESVG